MKRFDREVAVQLRRDGVTYQAILQRLGMTKSTLWRWLKAEGLVANQPQQYTERRLLAQKKAVEVVRRARLERTHAIMSQAKQEVGPVNTRELFLLGVALYWAEGTKQKSHNIAQRVQFSNSDPAMVRLFLAWLHRVCCVPMERLTFELYIHTSADAVAAQRFWSSALHVPLERFCIRLKRHNRSPHRKNVGTHYVGLVRITVRQSVALNRKIAGWVEGITNQLGESANGRPPDFGSGYPGSIPGSPATNGFSTEDITTT